MVPIFLDFWLLRTVGYEPAIFMNLCLESGTLSWRSSGSFWSHGWDISTVRWLAGQFYLSWLGMN